MKKSALLPVLCLVFGLFVMFGAAVLLSTILGNKPAEPIPVAKDDPLIPNTEVVAGIDESLATEQETEVITTEKETEVVATEDVTESEVDPLSEEELEGTGGDWEPEGGDLLSICSVDAVEKVKATVPQDMIDMINKILYEGFSDEPLEFISYADYVLTMETSKYTMVFDIYDGAAGVTSTIK